MKIIIHFFKILLLFIITIMMMLVSSNSFVLSQFTTITSSSSSSSSLDDINFYPFENNAKCETYIGDSQLSNCSKYLPYNIIYTSPTINQTNGISLADQYFSFIRSSKFNSCSQSYVFQTICFSLFPECQTYTNENKDIIVTIPVRTCLNECQQSIEWCNSTTSLLNCSSTMSDSSSYSNNNNNNNDILLPIYPKSVTYFNFEQYQGGILKLECANSFINVQPPPSNDQPTNPTLMPKETSSEQHDYDNKHRSTIYKIGISAAVFVPLVVAIALIWYNIRVRSNYFKKLENENCDNKNEKLLNRQSINENSKLI